ncbi:tetratricopeptide repeat protein [Peristeroidobacter agariperforans]|uniref:tetratricopeptide repeat protein n=1 Tax=Peristeroidobacter agariperforans TaxID=268404 RepID=UPI0013003AB2|nr:tetratricopeptide repeat protein [Peristeroidobacter agariperforans]
MPLASDMSSVRHAVLLAALFVAACSTSAKHDKPVQKAAAKVAPSARVDIQQDATGFTILEDVQVSADLRAEYESAVRMLELQQYEQGIAALLKIVESAANVTAVHIDLGMAYARSGDLEKAEESLKKALQLNPRHPIAYNELGMVYRRKGQFTEARASYEKALEIFPTFHFAQRNLAILCDVYLGDLACALQHYTAYQQAAPDDADTAKWLADLSVRAKR